MLIGIVFFGISVLNTMHDQTTMLILGQEFPHLSQTFKGFIMSIDNIFALFMLPLFGSMSDRCKSKWGKRKPFVFCGTLGACIMLLMFPIALGIPSLPLFITFICFFLIALGAYRSAGVSIVSDVTIKPLRSKANALINMMGAIAYVIGNLIVKMLFKAPNASTGIRAIPLVWMYIAFACVAIIALIVYMLFVKEIKLTKEREAIEKELGIDEEIAVEKEKIILSKEQRFSLILLLVSICLWTFGYNAITTFYPQYSTTILSTLDGDFTIATTIAAVAGLLTYIPTGMLAGKIGRRKTILIGYIIALTATLGAIFVKNDILMICVFVLIGMAQAMVIVNTLPMVVEFSNRNTIGQFTGFYYVATQLASTLTPLIGGITFDVCAYFGIAGAGGLVALFPYAAIFFLVAGVPMLFVKFGDGKKLSEIGK